MKRRLLQVMAGLSVVLLVAVSTLWLRSYWRGDRVGYRWTVDGELGWHRDVAVACIAGQFSVTRQLFHAPGAEIERGWYVDQRYARPGYAMDGGVGGIQHRTVTGPGRWLSEVRVPFWPVVLGLAVLPAVALRYRRRDRLRAAAGLCRACGYDLRATPGQCPECGHPAPSAAGAA